MVAHHCPRKARAALAERLNSDACRIHLLDLPVEKQTRLAVASRLPSGIPEDPVGWEDHQLAVELRLARALATHAWRAPNASNADAVLILTNRSKLCAPMFQASGRGAKGMAYALGAYSKALWDAALRAAAALPRGTAPVLQVVSEQDGACSRLPMPPDVAAGDDEGRRPTLYLVEALINARVVGKRAQFFHSPTPFARRPLQLPAVGAAAEWGARDPATRLLFFAGHVPKLFQSLTRYLLWKQLRNDSRATTQSRTINCTVGAYVAACSLRASQVAAKPARWFEHDFCAPYCAADWAERASSSTPSCGTGQRADATVPQLARALKSRCARYRSHASLDELPDMARDSARRMDYATYLGHAASHRFCLVVPGDWAGTPKVSEMVAVGGAGGCIPVFVLPHDGSEGQVARLLPYGRWLDYCEIGYVTPAKVAQRNMSAIMDALARVSAAEAARKHRALRCVRNAFVFRAREEQHGRGPGGTRAPDAADFILGEVCHRARLLQQPQVSTNALLSSVQMRGARHTGCMLPFVPSIT